MAKATTIKVKLVSTADTGYFYVTKKNSRHDREAHDEEVRPGRAEARRLQGSEDQVALRPPRNRKGAPRAFSCASVKYRNGTRGRVLSSCVRLDRLMAAGWDG